MNMPMNVSFIIRIWVAMILVMYLHGFVMNFQVFLIYSERKCSQEQINYTITKIITTHIRYVNETFIGIFMDMP